MRLRTRFLLVLAIFSGMLIIMAVLSARIVLTGSARQVDEDLARERLKKGQAVLSEEIRTLTGTAVDWASWDDTYDFMINRDSRYLDVNLVDGTFESLRMDGIFLYDTKRQFVAGMAVDSGGEISESVLLAIRGLIEQPDGLLYHKTEEPLAGFVVCAEEIWLVALAPILTSQDEGPTRGTLFMGRHVDGHEQERLRWLIAPSLSLLPADREWLPGMIEISAHALNSLQARVVISDVFGRGRVVMDIVAPRPAMGQIVVSLSYFVFLISACGVGILLLAVWLLDRWVLRSVTESVFALREGLDAAATVGARRPALRKTRDDEIGDLSDAVEAAIVAVETSARELNKRRLEAFHSQRLAALGTLAAGVAHEINNPNGVMSLNLNVLRRELERLFMLLRERGRDMPESEVEEGGLARTRKELSDIIEETLLASERIAGIVSSLKSFARPADGTDKELLSVPDLIKEAAHWLRHEYKQERCRLETAFDARLPRVCVNRQQLVQVFVNLLQNACQAASRPNSVVRVSGAYERKEESLTITVADDGRGMQPENVEHALDPFFTTRRSEGGMGLGLSISAAIVRAHGGNLNFDSREGAGTFVTVTLPIKEEYAHAP